MNLYKEFGIDEDIVKYVIKLDEELVDIYKKRDDISLYNQLKVINAFHKNNLMDAHFAGSTGYGYGDIGRDTIDNIFADIFHTEDALVRSHIASGTHAISLALRACLLPNDKLVYLTGKPYDTIHSTIGFNKESCSLIEQGVLYDEVSLKDGKIDIEGIKNKVTKDTKMVALQKSCGYENRNTFTLGELEEAIKVVKEINNNIIVFVDNCYGEFTSKLEPTDVGADIIAGSLIKNIGGGVARTGGYLAGRKDLIERVSYKLTAPGLGREVGSSLEANLSILQGLFLAPSVTKEAIKNAILMAYVYEKLGFEVSPKYDVDREDIIQNIFLKDRETLIEYCRGIQAACAVDSFSVPEPSSMPGYDSEVIMASGSFIQGSSIELSADAPIREPFSVFYQGGLTHEQGILGVMKTMQYLRKTNKLPNLK